MNMFYRFVRPQSFKQHRSAMIALPHGGVCLRFEQLPEGDLFFAHSRCGDNELFSRDVARRVADTRAEQLKKQPEVLKVVRGVPFTWLDTPHLVGAVIERCRSIEPTDTVLIDHYLATELELLATTLEQLLANNAHQHRLAESWGFAISGLGLTAYRSEK